MQSPNELIGTWHLTSFKFFSDPSYTDFIGHPLGPNALGRLTFSSDGYINTFLTNPDIARPLEKPMLFSSETAIARVARVTSGYCGRYTVFEKDGEMRLSTDVEVSLDPSLIGGVQERTVGFEKREGRDVLVLRPVEVVMLPSGEKAYAVLTWVKLDLSGDGNV